MSKILKNTTASPIVVTDTGVTVPASPGSYTIPAQDYLIWAASSNTVTFVGAGSLLVNDGSLDLSISNGTDLIKGLFPQITYAQSSTTSLLNGVLIQGAVTTAAPAYTTGQTNPLSLTTGGLLRVDASGSTITVGTHAVTQGTSPWVVGQSTAANLNATVVGTGTFAVQAAITAASSSISSGAIASGAFAAGSIPAGAISAGAASFVKLEDAASANADAGVACLAVRKATPADTSGNDGDYEFIQMSGGRVWGSVTVDAALPTGTNSIGQVTANAGTNLNTSALNLEATQTAFSVKFTSATGTATSVSASATSVTVLASNASRKGAVLSNDSTSVCYVKFGATASTTSFAVKMAGSNATTGELSTLIIENSPVYTGIIDAIWASATGSMRITEQT